MTRADETPVAVNGIDATTGDYLLPAVTSHDIATVAGKDGLDGPVVKELRARHRRSTERRYAPRHGIDTGDLGQTGWGVLFAADADPAVRAALRPLLEHRRRQAARQAEHRYREFAGEDGLRAGESKQAFLRRCRIGPGPVDPDVFPYYLLLVGGPEEIPFAVQQQLGVQHAVGRLSLGNPDAYRRYAENVVAAESAPPGGPSPSLSIFAPSHDDDRATALSVEHLATPLAAALESDWQVSRTIGPDASRDALLDRLSVRPDVLLAAAHGIGLPRAHPRQRDLQGALLCGDWPGPGRGPVRAGHWFGADGLTEISGVDLNGMIAFLFSCFGAGTPQHDEYHRGDGDALTVATEPFVAALPQALLGRAGGALAVVGQVDRMWSYSFLWPGVGRQTEVHRSTLACLRAGGPLGSALEYVGDRYAELASDLSSALQEVRLGKRADDAALAELWTACVDARNLVVLGDPAVRVVPRTGDPPRAAQDREVVRVHAAAAGDGGDPPVEIATYVAEDPAVVGYDVATGRITGARLHILTRVALDGTASHVVGQVVAAADAPRRAALVDLHARLIEVSLAARRALREAPGTREGG